MGEYDQPVVGMKSCFDLAVEEGLDKRWNGREWFIIRKADVQLSEDNVLLPYVRMGVEAREQVMRDNRWQDARITRPDHPLVKYADMFTRNFDLIAERKSVIYHLRELARATILARFLLESDIHLTDSWFNVANEENVPGTLEVPQLWNERAFKEIDVKNGVVVETDEQVGTSATGMYGGLDLAYGQAAPTTPYQQVAVAAPTAAPTPAAPVAAARAMVARRRALTFRRRRAGPSMLAAARLPAAPVALVPRGVDLSLDEFDSLEARNVGGFLQAHNDHPTIGADFWPCITGEGKSASQVFKAGDRDLLRSVFNPRLSDRRDEGDIFTPPDPSPAYLDKLRALLEDELQVRRRRKGHFLSAQFLVDKAGPLFPSSWTSTFHIAHKEEDEERALTSLDLDHWPSLEALASAKLAFDRKTEDGARFRIYRLGKVEVRTFRELEGEEAVGAVFSHSRPGEKAGVA